MSNYESLRSLIAGLGGAVIGYSGGVDSTLVAKIATDELGDGAVSVLIESCLTPQVEIEEAVELADMLGLNLVRLEVDALAVENLPDNQPDRCYHCKKSLFSEVIEVAKQRGLPYVLDGANADDESDYRPGSKATAELDVRSPLKELGLTKEQTRAISRDLGLPTWNKPSYACLASRVPYGTRLTKEVLKQIEDAEAVLRKLGFTQFRVRHHDSLARIELMRIEMDKLMTDAIRNHVVQELKSLGYHWVAMDLAGYRTGSLNEALTLED